MRQHDPEERYIEVYNAVVEYKRDHDGCSPSLQDIIDNTELRSKQHVTDILRDLQERGLIRLGAKGQPRSIEVVGARWEPPLDYYPATSIVEAFNELRERFGHHFDDVDPDKFMAEVREEGWC